MLIKAQSESVRAFEAALENDDTDKVTSAPDWAPAGEITGRSDYANYGVGYHLLRWPVLVGLILWILPLLVIYFGIRLYVSISEWLFVWRGPRRNLRQNLRAATSLKEWRTWAAKLDKFLGFNKWRDEDKSTYYDFRTVRNIVKQINSLDSTNAKDAELLAVILETCVKYNFAGIHNPQVYSQCYSGTKKLIDRFNSTVIKTIGEVASPDCPLAAETKSVLFKSMSINLGKSALCLSGGGSFCYRHLGVVRILLDMDLLPPIVSGTSGGGLIASLVCTRTDEELRELINPSIADNLTACWEPFPDWLSRWWRTGARFDSVDWAERAKFFTLGDLTFKEAYERTGKILNVSTVPANPQTPAILCNYITSPDCVIWSALLASAAVPGLLKPVVLMRKTRQGTFVPYSFGSRWRDGSFRTDIPTQALNTFFNVNYTIVSQVKPHIRLFAYLPRGQVGRPVIHKYSKSRWRGGFLLTAMETSVKLEIKKCLKLLRNLDLMPHVLDQDFSTVFLQKFEGSVTVWPRIGLRDFFKILSDPSREELAAMMLAGEKTVFPKISMISHFVELQHAVENGQSAFSL